MARKPAIILNRNDRKFVDPSKFTDHEERVWKLHAEGYTNKQIALLLKMTPGNVAIKLGICREKLAARET